MAEKIPVQKELTLLREQLDEANRSLCGKRPDDHILQIMTQVVNVKKRERIVKEMDKSLDTRFQALFQNQSTAINRVFAKERAKEQGYFKSSTWIFSLFFGSVIYLFVQTQTQANTKKFADAVVEQILAKSTGKSWTSTIYDWGAWACSPVKKLKFW